MYSVIDIPLELKTNSFSGRGLGEWLAQEVWLEKKSCLRGPNFVTWGGHLLDFLRKPFKLFLGDVCIRVLVCLVVHCGLQNDDKGTKKMYHVSRYQEMFRFSFKYYYHWFIEIKTSQAYSWIVFKNIDIQQQKKEVVYRKQKIENLAKTHRLPATISMGFHKVFWVVRFLPSTIFPRPF